MAKRLIIVVFLLLLAIGVTIAVPTIHAHADEPEEAEEAAATVEEAEAAEAEETVEEQPSASVDAGGSGSKTEWMTNEFLPQAASIVLLFIGMWISPRPQALNNNALARQMIAFAHTMGTNKDISEKQIAEIMGKYMELKDRFETVVGLIEQYKNEIGGVMESRNALLEIAKLGFGNTTELVKKGAAEHICKLAEAVEVKKDDEKVA